MCHEYLCKERDKSKCRMFNCRLPFLTAAVWYQLNEFLVSNWCIQYERFLTLLIHLH
uniref:Ovule protein n=1 Tax=Mesocestoides corti TaxID=53468 RepID=A0A5K3FW70_MESCO